MTLEQSRGLASESNYQPSLGSDCFWTSLGIIEISPGDGVGSGRLHAAVLIFAQYDLQAWQTLLGPGGLT